MKTFKIINLSDDTGNTEEFQISEIPMGSGRRSLCYEAMDTRRNIPRYIKKLKNNDPGDVREFGKAYKLQTVLSNVTKNTVPGLIGLYHDSDNVPHIVLEKFCGSTFRNADFPLLHDFFSMVLAIVQGLREYHNAGYLMLDLSADNVYCLAEKGTLSGAYFFDFDSVMTLEDARKVDAIPTSLRMSAPEVARGDFDRIGFQSDYFSLGAVVYERLFGRPPLSLLGFGNDKKYASVKCYRDELMSSVALREQLDQFFKNTLALSPEERYTDLDALASVVKKLCDLSHPNLQRTVRSNFYPDPGKIYVRTSQLDELKKFFLSRKDTYAVGVIHGESGCGKSTLAHALAKELEQYYDCVEWCNFDRRGFKGILEQITLVDLGKSVEEKESTLKLNNQRILIVIDNFDEDMSKQALTPWGNCHIVITSRYGVESFAGLAQSETCIDVPLGSSPELGWAVFQNVYHSLSGKKLSDEQSQEVDILLKKVGYHTYASDLIARALAKDFSPSAIEYIWEEKVTSRKDIQVGHKSVEATVEKHISALFTDQIRKLMRGKRKIETEILFLLSKDRIWNRELLCILVGDDPERGRKQAKEIIDRMVSRNLLKDEGDRFFGTYKGKAISVHPLVQMAIQRIFANKRKWAAEEHIFRALYNLYVHYMDDVHTEALSSSSWPAAFKGLVADKTISKLKELRGIGSKENTWQHKVALLHWVNQGYISSEIKDLLCLDADETYYAYLITDNNETVFFTYANEQLYPLLALRPVYPQERMPDADQVDLEMRRGEVEIRLLCCKNPCQRELVIPSDICGNPVYEVMGATGCPAKVVTIPEGICYIGPDAFAGSETEQVNFPKSLEAIFDYAFIKSSVRKITIPANVQVIGKFAFSDCDQLECVMIESERICIGYGAFHNCANLRKVCIQGTDVLVDGSAFWGCNNLKYIAASEEWKESNIYILESLSAYEPENEEEREMIEEYRKDMGNPINAALHWTSDVGKKRGAEIDEDAVQQSIGEMMTALGVDEID